MMKFSHSFNLNSFKLYLVCYLSFFYVFDLNANDEVLIGKNPKEIYEFNTNIGLLDLKLYETNALENNGSAADGLFIIFDKDGNNEVDINDAIGITNLDENFTSNNNGTFLSIESRAIPIDGEEIQLEVNTYRSTEYTIVAEGISMQCITAYLYDSYMDVSTEIPQNGSINYAYSISNGNSASIANDRFKIIMGSSISDITWNGSMSSDWNDALNWTPNIVPDDCSQLIVPDVPYQPYLQGNKNIFKLDIVPGGNITIPEGSNLIIEEDLNMFSESSSYASLVAHGNILVEGKTRYHRYSNSELNNRDLISPPLSGQSWQSFLTSDNNNNANLLFNNGVSPPNTSYLFGPFEKGNIDDYAIYNYDTSVSLQTGLGYRVATDVPISQGTGDQLIFTGTVLSEPVSINIWNDFTGNFPEWNLIGNPYPSYISVNAFLNHVGSTSGVTNLSLLNPDTAAIYGFDADNTDATGSNWTITNLINGPDLIAPGQGFFVSSKIASAILEFTPDMQVDGDADDFILGRTTNNTPYVKLIISTASESSLAAFYFIDGTSYGLDVGYDASIFGGTIPEFSIYSRLIEDDEGEPMAIQAFSTFIEDEVVIPLGVHANQGEALTFSISGSNIDDNTHIYLEDSLMNFSVLLNQSDHVFIPTTNLSGIGRFYLRVVDNTLNTDKNILDNVSIYINYDSSDLIVSGSVPEHTYLNLYDIQGRALNKYELKSSLKKNKIDLSGLNKGIYIADINSMSSQKSVKIIVN